MATHTITLSATAEQGWAYDATQRPMADGQSPTTAEENITAELESLGAIFAARAAAAAQAQFAATIQALNSPVFNGVIEAFNTGTTDQHAEFITQVAAVAVATLGMTPP